MNIIEKLIENLFSFYKTVYRLRRRNDQLSRRIFDQAFYCIILLILCITGLLLSQAGVMQFLTGIVSKLPLMEAR